MNKLLIQMLCLTFLVMSSVVYAQGVSEESAPAQDVAPAVEVVQDSAPVPEVVSAPVVPAPQVNVPKQKQLPSSQQMGELLRVGAKVRVRQEEEFDTNGNRWLEPNEIKVFYAKVYADSASGPVKNTSDVLFIFDMNEDGFIDRSEASALARY